MTMMTKKHWHYSMRECVRNLLACLGILYIADIVLVRPSTTPFPDKKYDTTTTTTTTTAMQVVVTKPHDEPPPSNVSLWNGPERVEQQPSAEYWNAISCHNPVPNCDLTDTTWGIPTILLSFGRSGSTVTWDTLAGLSSTSAGSSTHMINASLTNHSLLFQPSTEDLGKSMEATVHFFDNIPPQEHGKCALERILCTRQIENKQRIVQRQQELDQQHSNMTFRPGIYGTKWKPYLESFGHVKSRQALQWIAYMQQQQQHAPAIKVIYNQRNLLDVYVSKYKHEATHVPAHCHQGNAACVQKHLAAEQSLVVPTETLLEELQHWEYATNQTLALLHANHVDMIQVQYEKLYYSDHLVEEWNRLWAYLGNGNGQGATTLTKADILAHIEHVATSASRHADKMANYDEVQSVLQGTSFAKYLQR